MWAPHLRKCVVCARLRISGGIPTVASRLGSKTAYCIVDLLADGNAIILRSGVPTTWEESEFILRITKDYMVDDGDSVGRGTSRSMVDENRSGRKHRSHSLVRVECAIGGVSGRGTIWVRPLRIEGVGSSVNPLYLPYWALYVANAARRRQSCRLGRRRSRHLGRRSRRTHPTVRHWGRRRIRRRAHQIGRC